MRKTKTKKKVSTKPKTKALHKALAMRCAKEVPTSWLDPLLTGTTKVVGEPPYGCPDIERLLNAIRKRIEAVKA